MNPKNTWLLLVLAALLGGFIFAWDKYIVQPAKRPVFVLPGLDTNAVTSIQVRIGNRPELVAERTNGGWRLLKPLPYHASSEKVELLLTALALVQPDRTYSAQELAAHSDANAEFGFDSPLASLTLFSGKDRKQIVIGARTAPGEQVFVEVVGVPGVHLVTTNLLAYLPQSSTDWRDATLLDWKALEFDRVIVNNASRSMELQRNPTNAQWRLVKQKARADTVLVNELLRQLQALQVEQYVTDNPQADLDTYGLQTPELEITFANGTNLAGSLQFGKSPTNNSKLVYARRAGLESVWTVPQEPLKSWRAAASEFYDHRLMHLGVIPDSIEVVGLDRFKLVHETNLLFRVEPKNFNADTNYIPQIILTLAQLQVEQFVKDAAPESSLTNWGLATPSRQYTIRTSGTNAATVTLQFGDMRDGLVYARRTDEVSVYAISQRAFDILPAASWEMYDRRIWQFSEEDVARVMIEQHGLKRELIRSGTNAWSLAAGSIGVINTYGVEETVHRIGDLTAAFWTARGQFDRAAYGFTNPVHRLTFVLKDGAKREIEFGGEAPSKFPYATVNVNGEPWLFEFQWGIYQHIGTYLSIPAPNDR
ncbi:MAG: hypothetical protein RLY20_1529 [Verrucomicrobiota bacterium]|jgi:hypothetical protein